MVLWPHLFNLLRHFSALCGLPLSAHHRGGGWYNRRCYAACSTFHVTAQGPAVVIYALHGGGSPWQTVNAKKPGGYARLRQHVRLFNRLWRNFETLARYAHSKGNHIALEWPRNCKYWKLPKVKDLCKSIGLEQVHFDGCMLGLTSVVDGKPIKKAMDDSNFQQRNNQTVRRVAMPRP